MAQFNLSDYETVEQRHKRALELFPDLRVVIVNHTTDNDRAQATWVVEARVYLNAEDQLQDLPKATEWAFEIDGVGMANKTSALENACTSALGRALRWAFGGVGPSREEMEKVQRASVPDLTDDMRNMVAQAATLDELRKVWDDAVAGGYSGAVRKLVDERKKVLTK